MTAESAPGRVRTRTALALVATVCGVVAPLLTASPAQAAPAPAARAAPAAEPAPVPETPTMARFRAPVLDLPPGFRPEGITVDRRGTLYVSSLADGTVLRVDPSTGHRSVLLAGTRGRALRGLQVDARTGLLYVTGSQGTTGIVLAVDRRSGRVAKEWTVPGAGFLNDLVVTRRAVWVTDSRVDRLVRLPLDRDGRPADADPDLLPLDDPWPVPDPDGNRANGIRALDDGTLLLDHSTAGGLWAVDPEDGDVRRIEITGGPTVTGGDGLELDGDRLWIVRGTGQHSVAELRLDDHHGELTARWVRDLTSPSLDVPSTTVLLDDRLWTVNARFGVPRPATASYWVTGLPLDGDSSRS